MAQKRRLVPALAFLAVLAAGGCSTGEHRSSGAASAKPEPTLTIAWGSDPLADPRSLDPAFVVDRTAANILLNVMDPLVKLDENLEPRASLAEGWTVSRDGTRYTFTLRKNGRWTNGDPVTARDFEYSWKRTLSPELHAPNARRLFPIRGAAAYHACESGCAALAARVGVRALDAFTLVVRLRAPRPWFPVELSHPAFLAVDAANVEGAGERWTRPDVIVTDGPFRLAGSHSGRSLSLVKDPAWRNAATVAIGRVDGRIITDAETRVQAFDAGDVMVLDGSGLPASDLPALRERAEYERYRALATYYYGFNLRTIPDVHQRRAMSLAIDRRSLVEHFGRADELPAIGFTPPGMPGFDEIIGASPWLEERGDVKGAKAELERATDVKRSVNLVVSDEGANREIAQAAREAWAKLGIDTRIAGKKGPEYLGFLRPPNTGVDVYQVAFRYQIADPVDGLRVWTCGSRANYSNFCSRSYDRKLRRAERARDADARTRLYAAEEDALLGKEGAVPFTSIYWYTFPNLEALAVKESFFVNPLGQIDLARVELA